MLSGPVLASSTERALAALRMGGVVLVHDDRRDRGDLVSAAELTTHRAVNLMSKHGRGLVAVAIAPSRARELELGPQPVHRRPRDDDRAPSLVSIEARGMVTTGISAADRASTITAVADSRTRARDLSQPGHVFPVMAAEGGLLERFGRAEAALDAVRLAGLRPAAALCEVLDDCGDLAGPDELRESSARLGLPLVTIGELAEARFDGEWPDR